MHPKIKFALAVLCLIPFSKVLGGTDGPKPQEAPSRPMFTCTRRILLNQQVLSEKDSAPYFENNNKKFIDTVLSRQGKIDSVFYVDMGGPYIESAELLCEGLVVRTLKVKRKSEIVLTQSGLLYPLAQKVGQNRLPNTPPPELYLRIQDDIGRANTFLVYKWKDSIYNYLDPQPDPEF